MYVFIPTLADAQRVPDLTDKVLPVFDYVHFGFLAVFILRQSKYRTCTPEIQLSDGFPNGDLALGSVIQFLSRKQI